MFIRWTLFLGLAMVAFLCCAWGSLPGQEPREITLPIVRTEVASWDKESTRTVKRDDRIIRAYASFSPSTYNVTLPKNVVIDSALANKGKVRDSWEIVGMTPWIGDTESKTSADHWQVPTGTAEEERYHQRLSLDNVDAKKQYTIRVVLRQKGSTICAEQMKALVRGNEGVQEGALEVKAYYVALASPKPSSSEMSESQKVNK